MILQDRFRGRFPIERKCVMARGIVAVCIGGLLTVVVVGYAPATEEDSRAV